MTETRRHAIKMLGTIGLTCAFPFAADELYGQHVHVTLSQTPATGPYSPAFFTPAEYAALSRLTDVIIPPTGTPGAAAAGVPEYIDRVVSLNAEHQPLVRAGLAWLQQQAKTRFSREFLSLDDADHVAILQPLSDETDRRQRDVQRGRFRTEAQGAMVYYVAVNDKTSPAPSASTARPAPEADLPVRFFRLVKNLTADGYYTSRVGLLDELGYAGNTALAKFPACSVPEH
ncbi:MAG TPA: gluconate 2-dehydrogenase subunit 3 family protein [Vicinamibacterales bacterium]|nr:gluconate 2-dehydrogenase subunit 3 family protein [Vicinamibacterales bacterium]